jgi:hypothetical protein
VSAPTAEAGGDEGGAASSEHVEDEASGEASSEVSP